MKMLLIARFTLREASRKKAVHGAVLLTCVFLVLYAVGLYFAYRQLNSQMKLPPAVRHGLDGELLLAGLYFVNFIAGLLAIFTSVGTISSEIEQRTLHAIVPKPLHRWEIVAGKWLGFGGMLSAYVVVTAGATMAVAYVQSGYYPTMIIAGIGLMVLQTLTLLSLSMLGTSVLSTVTNGIIVFMLYALALAGGRLEQLGTLMHNQTLIDIGIGTSLVIPSDALWRLTSGLLGVGGLVSGGSPQPGLFSVVDPPSNWMAIYAACYVVAGLAGAIAIFQRRDL